MTSKFACSRASAPSSVNNKLRSTTPGNWWRSTPSSSVHTRGWVRCICKPCWTATVATPGGCATRASCHHLGPCVQQNGAAFFEAHEARVYTILSDNGREFCGAVPATGGDCEHRTTKVRWPQSIYRAATSNLAG